MKRRGFIKGSITGAAAASAISAAPAKAQGSDKPGFVLVHGSWHGGWCWDLVEKHLNAAGHMTMAIDLPGHGLNASIPAAFKKRPLDPGAFATEPSAIASIGTDEYADAVLEGAARLEAMGVSSIYAVGHSMGGVPVTFAAAKSPDTFAGLVYLTALAPTPGKPAGAYTVLEEQQAKSKLGPTVMADPAIVGALRIDPRSEDPEYLAIAKEALAADVDDDLLAAVMHLLTPDAPVAMYGEVPEFLPGFETLKRLAIRCTADMTIVPSTMTAIVDDMNAAWPAEPTKVVDLDSSHEAMFSQPEAVANHIMSIV